MKDRYCPWCDTKYQAESNKGGPLCDECRRELMEQRKKEGRQLITRKVTVQNRTGRKDNRDQDTGSNATTIFGQCRIQVK